MATIKKGTCRAQVTLPEFQQGISFGTTIQYFVGITPITSAIPVNGMTMSAGDIQTLLTNDPTRMLSGYTITVVSFTASGLTVNITKTSNSQNNSASGKTTEGPLHSARFVCNRNIRREGWMPPPPARQNLCWYPAWFSLDSFGHQVYHEGRWGPCYGDVVGAIVQNPKRG